MKKMKKKRLLLTAIAMYGFAMIISAQVPSYVPTNGLVGYWPFNGNANDGSGNGNNGIVNGATLTSDRFGNSNKAYSYDGVSSIKCPPIALGSEFSISLNFTIELINQPYSSLIGNWQGPSLLNGFEISKRPNNSIGFTFSENGTNAITLESNTIFDATNNWVQMTIVNDDQQLKVYVDGVIETQISNANLVFFNGDSIIFGATRNAIILDPTSYFWNGKIDDIGIWNRALTQQEITDLYNHCQLSVNTQPINQTTNINTSAQFVVSSSDTAATYQWQTDLGVGFQNLSSVGQYSGSTNDTLTVSNVTMSNNNQPFRCIINSGSCSDTSNVALLTVNNNIGVNEFTQDNLFSIYPNPAQTILNVKADSKLIGSNYQILDNVGRVVFTGNLNSQNSTIELVNLSSGIYMFSVGKNINQTFKIIKQ